MLIWMIMPSLPGGLWELYQATFQVEHLEEALRLTKEMCQLFWDTKDGGFYFTAEDGSEELGARAKEIADMALPSGNSVAAWNLLHLAGLTGNVELEDAARGQLHAFGGAVDKCAPGHILLSVCSGFFPGAASGDCGSRGEG